MRKEAGWHWTMWRHWCRRFGLRGSWCNRERSHVFDIIYECSRRRWRVRGRGFKEYSFKVFEEGKYVEGLWGRGVRTQKTYLVKFSNNSYVCIIKLQWHCVLAFWYSPFENLQLTFIVLKETPSKYVYWRMHHTFFSSCPKLLCRDFLLCQQPSSANKEIF